MESWVTRFDLSRTRHSSTQRLRSLVRSAVRWCQHNRAEQHGKEQHDQDTGRARPGCMQRRGAPLWLHRLAQSQGRLSVTRRGRCGRSGRDHRRAARTARRAGGIDDRRTPMHSVCRSNGTAKDASLCETFEREQDQGGNTGAQRTDTSATADTNSGHTEWQRGSVTGNCRIEASQLERKAAAELLRRPHAQVKRSLTPLCHSPDRCRS